MCQKYERNAGGVSDDGFVEGGLCHERVRVMKRGLLVIDVQNEYFIGRDPAFGDVGVLPGLPEGKP